MTASPAHRAISFTEPMVRQLRSGTKVETRRPTGRLASAHPGDLLWVREPVHFEARWERFAPLQIVERGYTVAAFAADLAADLVNPAPHDPMLGRKRNAREMPKACHRMHLVVRHVRTERLQLIDSIGAQAEGVADRAAYRTLWDTIHPGGVSIGGTPVRWTDNPLVDVIAFTVVLAPLPAKALA